MTIPNLLFFFSAIGRRRSHLDVGVSKSYPDAHTMEERFNAEHSRMLASGPGLMGQLYYNVSHERHYYQDMDVDPPSLSPTAHSPTAPLQQHHPQSHYPQEYSPAGSNSSYGSLPGGSLPTIVPQAQAQVHHHHHHYHGRRSTMESHIPIPMGIEERRGSAPAFSSSVGGYGLGGSSYHQQPGAAAYTSGTAAGPYERNNTSPSTYTGTSNTGGRMHPAWNVGYPAQPPQPPAQAPVRPPGQQQPER